MAWRQTDNPYHILVSEIMLQQTQIERVLGKYPVFIKKYPDFRSLARARVRSLYSVWQGMGYNRRALGLRNIARMIVRAPYHGTLPSDVHTLMSLPFVGQSTAGAVAAFAFNRPSIFIETNIRRVYIHFFFRDKKRVRDLDIMPLIEKTLDRRSPRQWYYALMDYGAVLRTLNENPNRKSAHYKQQGAFAGSDRQIRGKILNFLMNTSPVSLNAIQKELLIPDEKIMAISDQLVQEGFIKKKGRTFLIS
jgi:A/G-specific adenine glycosylase